MLDFLWTSKSGRQAAEAAAVAGKQLGDGGGADSSKAPVLETLGQTPPSAAAGSGTADTGLPAEEHREGLPPGAPILAHPPVPPGGSAEFTANAANGQEEVEQVLSACAGAEPSSVPIGLATDLSPSAADGHASGLPRVPAGRRRGRRLVAKESGRTTPLTAPQRLLLLDTWRRSGLPAGDFAALVGLSRHTLYAWKKKFDSQGPAGLLEQPRGGPKGSRLPELTKRTIVMLKAANPDWGCQRISDLLGRGPALPASPGAVARVLHEAGYELEEVATRPHPDKIRHFERAQPNQLWQTDLFTFVLKRQNRRVYLVAFMDDHSRFIVGYGLHASQSSALVLEVLRAALLSYGTPEEILTDNGSQYITWRGKSMFTKELEKRGIKQVVAAPRRPQTLGKIERFWGTLWRECVESAVFIDLGDAQRRIGWFIDHYNFARTHSGIEGLVPADRFFGAASAVKRTLAARVAANALELARHGVPQTPFYLTGQVGGQPFSVHAEGERKILIGAGGTRQEVELTPPAGAVGTEALPQPVCPVGVVTGLVDEGQEEPPAPGTSPLDEGLARWRASLPAAAGGDA
jgi:transposase InsO family protein